MVALRGGVGGRLTWKEREKEREGGSSVETHKPSSLAGAGYNDTQ